MTQEEIKKYKSIRWFNLKDNTTFYGIDVVMVNGNVYHLSEMGMGVFFDNEADAKFEAKRLNKSLQKS